MAPQGILTLTQHPKPWRISCALGKSHPTHIALGMDISGCLASSAIAGNIPVALKVYAPWIKPNTHCLLISTDSSENSRSP